MLTIADLCKHAKLDRASFNNLRISGRNASWGEEKSEGYAVRLGLFSAFKACGFQSAAAVSYADALASKRSLPKWYVGSPLDGEEQFLSAAPEQVRLRSLLGVAEGGEGEQAPEGQPVSFSFAPVFNTLVIVDLHGVRSRMLALFK